MDCPNCGLFNPDTALRCDCGYDLTAKDETARQARQGQARRRIRRIVGGSLSALVGTWGTIAALESGGRLFVSIALIVGGVAVVGSGLRKGPQEANDYIGP